MIGSIEIVVKSIIDAELLDIDLAPVENIVNPVFSIDIGVAVVGCSGSGTPVSSLVTVLPMLLVLCRRIILRPGIHITDKETARNVPAPVTTYALFCDGKFITHSIQSDKKFLALAGVRS